MARKQVSDRDYLAADGSVVDKIEEATGARYSLKAGESARNFDWQTGMTAGSAGAMCAIFGFHTKVGNVANSVLNDKTAPGSASDAAAAIEEFISYMEQGQWGAPSEGGGGFAVDRDALAGAFVDVFNAELAAGTRTLPEGKEAPTFDRVRQRMEDDPAYLRALQKARRENPAIAAEYSKRTAKSAVNLGDLI